MPKKVYLDMQFVKAEMQRLSLSIKEMAAKMNLSVPTVRRWLNGADQQNITLLTLFRFANALEISFVQLLNSKVVTL